MAAAQNKLPDIMAAIINPPTAAQLAIYAGPFESPNLNALQRLCILIEAQIVLLNFKGGTNYIGNHRQLTQDALTDFKGFTPDQWGYSPGTNMQNDPGPILVGSFVTQANSHDATNMPTNVNTILTKIGEQIARPPMILTLQNIYLQYLLLTYD